MPNPARWRGCDWKTTTAATSLGPTTRLAGPIEVMLQLAHNDNIVGDPPLPARATVPARGSALVAVLTVADPTSRRRF